MPKAPTQEDLLRIIDRIYQAAVDPRAWEAVMDDLRRTLDCAASNLNLLLPLRDGGRCADVVGPGYDPALLATYPERWSEQDILVASTRTLAAGSLVLTSELVPIEEIRRHPIYQEFCVPQDLGGHGMVGVLEQDRGLFAVHRAIGAEPLREEERAFVRLLMPHMLRAYQVRKKLALADASCAAAEDVLERIPVGVIVLGEAGQVLRANRRAERLLALEDGLSREAGTVRATSAREHEALQRAVRGAAATGSGEGTEPGGAVSISRPSGRAALALLVTPVRRGSPLLGEGAGLAAIFVVDPEERLVPPARLLRGLYGLTETEARVALAVASGRAPKEAASDLDTSVNTVKTHLRAIFSKTDTDGQAALARLLARLALLPPA